MCQTCKNMKNKYKNYMFKRISTVFVNHNNYVRLNIPYDSCTAFFKSLKKNQILYLCFDKNSYFQWTNNNRSTKYLATEVLLSISVTFFTVHIPNKIKHLNPRYKNI